MFVSTVSWNFISTLPDRNDDGMYLNENAESQKDYVTCFWRAVNLRGRTRCPPGSICSWFTCFFNLFPRLSFIVFSAPGLSELSSKLSSWSSPKPTLFSQTDVLTSEKHTFYMSPTPISSFVPSFSQWLLTIVSGPRLPRWKDWDFASGEVTEQQRVI